MVTTYLGAARERQAYRYGDIAEILGFGGAGVMAQFLGPIMWEFCEDNELFRLLLFWL